MQYHSKALMALSFPTVNCYRAVEFPEFGQAFSIYWDLEDDLLRKTVAEECGENPEIGVDEMRDVMVKLGENVFPWAVAEALGGQDVKVDVDGFIQAFHELRHRCCFTFEEKEELSDVFDKFDQDMSGNISASEFSRVLKYMGFNPPDEMVSAAACALVVSKDRIKIMN